MRNSKISLQQKIKRQSGPIKNKQANFGRGERTRGAGSGCNFINFPPWMRTEPPHGWGSSRDSQGRRVNNRSMIDTGTHEKGAFRRPVMFILAACMVGQ